MQNFNARHIKWNKSHIVVVRRIETCSTHWPSLAWPLGLWYYECMVWQSMSVTRVKNFKEEEKNILFFLFVFHIWFGTNLHTLFPISILSTHTATFRIDDKTCDIEQKLVVVSNMNKQAMGLFLTVVVVVYSQTLSFSCSYQRLAVNQANRNQNKQHS